MLRPEIYSDPMVSRIVNLPKGKNKRNPIAESATMTNAFLIKVLMSSLFLYLATLGYRTLPKEYAISANIIAIRDTPEYKPTS